MIAVRPFDELRVSIVIILTRNASRDNTLHVSVIAWHGPAAEVAVAARTRWAG